MAEFLPALKWLSHRRFWWLCL